MSIRNHTIHFLLLLKIVRSPTWMGPGAKLSNRLAIHGKLRLFAESVWSWPQGQAEVGRDQESPGNTQIQSSSNLILSKNIICP